MLENGLEVVGCGANVPFADEAIFYGPINEMVDQKAALIPDFIANCGMARAFAYFMSGDILMTDDAIFKDVSNTIQKALKDVHAQNPDKKLISEAAFKIALEKLL